MRISYKDLRKLTVETELGDDLGSVCDVIVDVDSSCIVQYKVRSSVLDREPLLVSKNQVLSISHEKMIVRDSVIRDRKENSRVQSGSVDPEPIVMRK